MHARIAVLVLLLGEATATQAREGPPATESGPPNPRTASSVILPVLAYTPDTGFMLGGTFLRFFYLEQEPQARPSVLSPVVIRTFKDQLILLLGSEFNWDRARNRIQVTPSYQRFPENFYGIGRDAAAKDEEDVTPVRSAVESGVHRAVWSQLWLGLGFTAIHHRLARIAPGELLAGGSYLGTATSQVTQPGLRVTWDGRDHTWAPRSGLFLQGRTDLARKILGGDYTFSEIRTDLRGYLPAGERGCLAWQALLAVQHGEVPFFVMPRLGGQEGLRGYPADRYRDRTLASAQVEWRSGEVRGRFGWTVFAGIGDVAPRPADLSLRAELWCAGCGLRYTLNRQEQVKLRADFGVGHGSSGFYLSLGEAF